MSQFCVVSFIQSFAQQNYIDKFVEATHSNSWWSVNQDYSSFTYLWLFVIHIGF